MHTTSKSKMATGRKELTEEDFKKNIEASSELGRSKIRNRKSVPDDEDDTQVEFKEEDKLICRLYRQVVDDIMSCHKLREAYVDAAIRAMKEEISQGHRKGFRRFRGIDFCKPANCCGYLRRYAVCHTGLVKQIMWKFFNDAEPCSLLATHEITKRKHLKIISLGGGPGNDLVGFCCALQEVPNGVQELDMYVVDVSEGWKAVFPKILRKARDTDFGSFSQCVKDIKINTGFMAADLTASNMFENKTLSATLRKVNVVLMVKLTSFLSDTVAADLINNVVDSMKVGAKLIFVDQPYDGSFFREIKSLQHIYHSYSKYELSFNPSKYQSPCIDSSQAHVGIYEKIDYVSSSESDDSSETDW